MRSARASAAPILVLALVLAGCGAGGSDDAGDATTSTEATTTTAVPGETLPEAAAGADLDARVDAAIERARTYLRGVLPESPSDAVLGLSLLHRRYGEPLGDVDLVGEMRRRMERDGTAAEPTALITLRVAGDRSVVEAIDPPAGGGDGWFFLRALLCEEHPLDATFATGIRDALAWGGYRTTHGLLGVRWARELGCDAPELDRLADEAVAAVDAIIERADRTDIAVGLEAAAFRSYATDWSVTPEIADLAVRTQQPDGGWPEDLSHPASDWHATSIGLWVLLAYRQPDAPDTSWIVDA